MHAPKLALVFFCLSSLVAGAGCAADTEDGEEVGATADALVVTSSSCQVEHSGEVYTATATIDTGHAVDRMHFLVDGMRDRNKNNARIEVLFKNGVKGKLATEDNLPTGRLVDAPLHPVDMPRFYAARGSRYHVDVVFDFPGDDKTCRITLQY